MASSSSESVIMGALINFRPDHLSALSRSLAGDLRLQQQRLLCVLLSRPYFSLILSHLRSLTLPQKTLLLGRFLLRSLHALLPSSSSAPRLRLRDFDAALLLLAMIESHDPDGPSTTDWHVRISDHVLGRLLKPAGFGGLEGSWGVLGHYVAAAAKCRRLLEAVGGGGDKSGRTVAASAEAVLSLPTVECAAAGWRCAICQEEIEVGRDVCGLPCRHVFHWICAFRWLRERNTCPCCRFQLSTDDVFSEIDRIWKALLANSSATQT